MFNDQATHQRTMPSMSTFRLGERGDDVIYSFCFDHSTGQLAEVVFVTHDEDRFQFHGGQCVAI